MLLILGAAAVLALILFCGLSHPQRPPRPFSGSSGHAIYRAEKSAADPASRRIKCEGSAAGTRTIIRAIRLSVNRGLPPVRSEDPPEPAH